MTHTIGCIFDHGCRNVEELDRAVIDFAIDHKFEPPADFVGGNYSNGWDLSETTERVTSIQTGEWTSELADSAIDYLNSLELPPYTYYGNDGEAGAFGLWPNVDCSFSDDVIDVNDRVQTLPSFVRHVNDHGNVTLYAVELKEVWSVV